MVYKFFPSNYSVIFLKTGNLAYKSMFYHNTRYQATINTEWIFAEQKTELYQLRAKLPCDWERKVSVWNKIENHHNETVSLDLLIYIYIFFICLCGFIFLLTHNNELPVLLIHLVWKFQQQRFLFYSCFWFTTTIKNRVSKTPFVDQVWPIAWFWFCFLSESFIKHSPYH